MKSTLSSFSSLKVTVSHRDQLTNWINNFHSLTRVNPALKNLCLDASLANAKRCP